MMNISSPILVEVTKFCARFTPGLLPSREAETQAWKQSNKKYYVDKYFKKNVVIKKDKIQFKIEQRKKLTRIKRVTYK
jgi:hypothetical protein